VGFRDGIKSGGGGFFNNVDGEIVGYEFTNMSPGANSEETDWLYFVPQIQVDGADEPQSQHLFFGSMEDFDVSKDGLTVTANEGNVRISEKTPAGLFLASLIDKGFDESQLPDITDGEPLNLEPVIGTRIRLVQQIDEAGNAKRGKRKVKDKKTGKIVEYNRTNTVVAAVLGSADAKPAKGAKGAKASAKPAAGKNKKAAEEDLTDEAVAVLTDILSDAKDNTVKRNALSVPLAKKLIKNENREALKKMIQSEEFLETEAGWSYDAKKGVIAAE
jgi:hypothetical protein